MTIDGVEILLLARRGNVEIASVVNEEFLTKDGYQVAAAMKMAVNQAAEMNPDKFVEGAPQ